MHREEALKEQAAIYRAYYETFSSVPGVKVLEDMTKEFLERTSFVKNDPHETAFNEGHRDVVLRIRACMEIGRDPGKWVEEKLKTEAVDYES